MFSCKVKNILCLVLVLLAPAQSVRPISETTVNICALGGGALSGALAGYGIYNYARDSKCSDTSTMLFTGLGSAAAGFAVGALIYSIMSQYTPTGRFAYAQGVINGLMGHQLIMGARDNREQVVSKITSRYGTSWPLVAARESLMRHSVELGSAVTALDAAYSEAMGSAGSYPLIMQGYHPLRANVSRIYQNIEELLVLITSDGRYDLQVQLFEKHMEQVRQQQHERQLQQDKLNEKRWEKYKDREHERRENERERDYKRAENSKDRKLVADRPDAKLNFNLGGR